MSFVRILYYLTHIFLFVAVMRIGQSVGVIWPSHPLVLPYHRLGKLSFTLSYLPSHNYVYIILLLLLLVYLPPSWLPELVQSRGKIDSKSIAHLLLLVCKVVSYFINITTAITLFYIKFSCCFIREPYAT